MYTAGELYHIDNYEFEDENGENKDKFLLVLWSNAETQILLRILPSSRNYVPEGKDGFHGCRNSAESRLSYYILLENRVIGLKPNGREYCFKKNTFLYFQNGVEDISHTRLDNYQPNRIKMVAQMHDDELGRILKCLKGSMFLKRKHKKMLEG